jgi:hypothetical protein
MHRKSANEREKYEFREKNVGSLTSLIVILELRALKPTRSSVYTRGFKRPNDFKPQQQPTTTTTTTTITTNNNNTLKHT